MVQEKLFTHVSLKLKLNSSAPPFIFKQNVSKQNNIFNLTVYDQLFMSPSDIKLGNKF